MKQNGSKGGSFLSIPEKKKEIFSPGYRGRETRGRVLPSFSPPYYEKKHTKSPVKLLR